MRSHQQEAAALVVTNPIGPFRRGSRLFCSSTYAEKFAELVVGCEGMDCPAVAAGPSLHFTSLHSTPSGGFWDLSGTALRHRVLGQSCRGLVLAPGTAPFSYCCSMTGRGPTTVSGLFRTFLFVLNGEDGGVGSVCGASCGARSSPAVWTGVW